MVSNAKIIGDIVLIKFVWECTKVKNQTRLDVISINGEVIEYVNIQNKLLLLYWWVWLTTTISIPLWCFRFEFEL